MKPLLPSLLFVLFILSGCTKTVYVDRAVEVKVPVKCKVPVPNCPHLSDLNDSEVVFELDWCNGELKKALNVCL
jgi:hypothetical protein